MAIRADTTGELRSAIVADPAADGAALQHGVWRSFAALSSRLGGVTALAGRIERFLDAAGFDRAPWLAVGFGTGIALWFTLDNRWEWLGLIAFCLGLAAAAAIAMSPAGRFPFTRLALLSMALALAAGCATVWARSAMSGTAPIPHVMVPLITARVLERTDEPAEGRSHLLLAMREPGSGRAIRVRVAVPQAMAAPPLVEGAIVRLRARLLPPAPPRLPGSFDFARAAWFSGIAATGSVIGRPQIVVPAPGAGWLARARRALAAHVRQRIAGSPGGIAAIFATGERGGIAAPDAQAMRDAGLAHLLVVGGLHVGAVVGLAYALAIRLLALVPAIALRVRLPLLAAGAGAAAGIGYTLLTGAQVSTLRACAGCLLVLAALALGRQPHSLRLLAVAALAVMMAWPEAVVGATFQMSFGSVLAIIALHEARPMRAFLAHRAEPWPLRLGREAAMLLLTGLVIDLALMPIALAHFHRAGLYGAIANLFAIPLSTFVVMPSLGAALALDLAGLGAPAWWLAGRSLTLLLGIAHWAAGLPGSVTLLPELGAGRFAVFVAAMLWLGLWRGKVRLLALVPAVAAGLSMLWLRPPDVMITGDGGTVGLVSDNGADLVILREGRSSFTRDRMMEIAGMSGTVAPLDAWPGARCNRDFCLVAIDRGGRVWRLLIARTRAAVSDAALARACAGVDILVARQIVYGPCRPALIRADHALLAQTGGLALDLVGRQVTSVAQGEGDHPWWPPSRSARSGSGDEPDAADIARAAAADHGVVPGPGL